MSAIKIPPISQQIDDPDETKQGEKEKEDWPKEEPEEPKTESESDR